MPFAVLPALIPDIRAVYDVYFAAFSADPHGRQLLDILFPDGYSSEQFRTAQADATLAWWHRPDSNTQYTYKCVDVKTQEVVGMALCDVFTSAPRESVMPKVEWLAGEKRERAEKVLTPLWEVRDRLWKGRGYIYVHAFAVHPKHQGHGAGAALVKALVGLGDTSGLPIYLESSPGSEGLYRKLGFSRLPKDTASVVHAASLIGTAEDVEVPLMVHLPGAEEEGEGGFAGAVAMDGARLWGGQQQQQQNNVLA
ncbi:hypothetical protein B0H63DRAFT_140280 [Podospora didyma]|uniref:N-acetyltransferase domain-containing protein n=1 Tax=Podospora didyma TaxID=330526 RepID=A0AAE0NSJ4_9PEZI|nr:hypothetical protein B0H63DRAFT_140280 [Podospora didyma]